MLVVGPPHVAAHAADLPTHLPADALVVVNQSRVVPARLQTERVDGRPFELLLCDPAEGQGVGSTVQAWVRGAKKLKPGDVLTAGALQLRALGPDAVSVDPRARAFAVVGGEVLPTLHARGSVPLPPYIDRPQGPDADDLARYQTTFAGPEGSVAAPTAGLHFEADVLAKLDVARIVLHVGPGTFLPMDVDDVTEHRVGSERIEISTHAAAKIEAARAAGRPIVAIGTTVVRALEGIVSAKGCVAPGAATTALVVTPGFRFQVVTHLVTNFHLPKSSLLMLTCALGGRERVLQAYAHAVAARYRFYSYGDCMLVGRAPEASP